MKQLFICLFFPLFLFGQTVHHDDDKIIYTGHINLAEKKTEVLSRLQQVFPKIAGKLTDSVLLVSKEEGLEAQASLRLKSPYAIIRKVHFSMSLIPETDGYTYTVDSVFVTEKRRGWKEKRTDAEDMIEALEETGNAAIELEILLNEIDLRIQQLLTILETEMRKAGSVRKENETAVLRGKNELP